ncbi:MAG: exosortase/archaeosortase family protein [Verrucomicrobia bacterium]|nr:MAG: exosortase/archaeosortase family protein [Verrucomicrobiota bacterium]
MTIPEKKLSALWPLALALAWLWFAVIRHLHVEWTLNEQYNYGWAVPFLCLFLLWKRCESLPPPNETVLSDTKTIRLLLTLLIAALALFYFPIRLIEEANPDWRLVSWAMSLVAVGITMGILALTGGRRAVIWFGFPLLYFLIAVPWPAVPERTIIQGLSRFNASLSTELVGWFGVPALARGNLIEVGSGVVGVDEACSGIRSMQATVMLSLFFGELYRLRPQRRLDLVMVGLFLALFFNLLRTSLLVFVAARQGTAAMEHWHDPASITIILGSFTGLWLTSRWMRRHEAAVAAPGEIPLRQKLRELTEKLRPALAAARIGRLAVLLGAWFLISELLVAAWYVSHERRLPPPQIWTAEFPRTNPEYHEHALPPRTRQLLRHDEELNAQWRSPTNDSRWQGTFLRWNPGRAATYLAHGHTPEICLTAAGGELKSQSDVQYLRAQGLDLPVRFYRVVNGEETFDVLYCLWEDRTQRQDFQSMLPDYSVRFNAVLAGHRQRGQRSLELAVRGFTSASEAQASLTREFIRAIKVPAIAP